jgi:carbonic anhydrase
VKTLILSEPPRVVGQHGKAGAMLVERGAFQTVSRRDLLRRTVIAAVLGTTAAPVSALGAPQRAGAQAALGPDAALKRLMDGNRRFTTGKMIAIQEDLAILRSKTAEQQEPFAAVLSCADSRVPVELLFDQSIGHVFVTRVAGNIATPSIIASLEYGAVVLGTRLIMVLGHGGCGAVKAALKAEAVPGQISTLFPYIRPAVDQAAGNLETAIKANAKIQAHILREASPAIAGLIKQNTLRVVAAYYDLSSGRVTLED